MSVSLDFKSVSLSYDDSPIVSDVSLQVHAGEVVGLVGPNGAGKTTLLRGVTCDVGVVSGGIELGGRRIEMLSAKDRARIVAVLPQTVVAEAAFSAREFVAMGRHAHLPRFGGASPHDWEVVDRCMQRTDTRALALEPVTTMSGGDLQRLALAQALAQEPEVLLLDEPTSHLDVNHRLQILDLCRGLADEGIAVLGVFHDLDLAARYSDRIAVLAQGRLVEDGPPAAVLRPDLIRDVFGVRAVVHTDPATQSIAVTPLLRDEEVADSGRGSVLVVGGSGEAAWLLGSLVRAGWSVSLAAITTGDTDQSVARVLGVDALELPPFAQMEQQDEEEVLRRARACDVVIVSGTPFGRANVGNLRAAIGAGAPTILVGTMDGRDYTGGVAQGLWDAAVAAGATLVSDEAAAVHALEEVAR